MMRDARLLSVKSLLAALCWLCLTVETANTQLLDLHPGRFARRRYERSRNITSSRSIAETSLGLQPLLDFVGLVNKYGYPGEEHTLTTLDGYKLRIHRIPGSPVSPKAEGKPIVYFQHGLLASADTWVLMGPQKDLAYMLADAGYDVWLGNIRGNTYSRDHERFSCDYDKEFWQFSFHEVALFDAPAIIDYMLETTGQKSIVWIGHSMGTTISYVLLSMKPEYNQKFNLVISLAPVAFWREPHTPLVQFLKNNAVPIKNMFVNARIFEILPLTGVNSRLANSACREKSGLHQLCVNIFYFLSGYNPGQLDKSLIPMIFSYLPAGTSVKTLMHYNQNIVTGDFKMYDNGFIKNFATYKRRDSPAYDLRNITAPVALFYGGGDALVAPVSVQELAVSLPNVVTLEAVPDERFSHLDFIFSKDIKMLLNDRLMDVIPKFTRQENTL